MLPMRCFSCNTMVGHTWSRFNEDKRAGYTAKDAIDRLGLRLMCCRRMLLTHVTVVDDIMIYSNKDHALDECGTVFMCNNETERTVNCE